MKKKIRLWIVFLLFFLLVFVFMDILKKKETVKIPSGYLAVQKYAKNSGFKLAKKTKTSEIYVNANNVTTTINYQERKVVRDSTYQLKTIEPLLSVEVENVRYLSNTDLLTIFPKVKTKNWYKKSENRLVAHAGGGVMIADKIYAYTNSKEALIQNYNDGMRVFELDLNLTSDNQLAVVHDWSWVGYPNSVPTAKQWKKKGWTSHGRSQDYMTVDFGKDSGKLIHLTPMMISDVIEFMKVNPDVYIVTDTKESQKKEVVQEQFKLLKNAAEKYSGIQNRIVPQIYNQKMYDWIEEKTPFQSYIYTLYQSTDPIPAVTGFVNIHPKVVAVAMSADRASPEMVKVFNKNKISVFTHTVDSLSTIYPELKMGVTGFYTNNVHPGAFNPILKNGKVLNK